MLIRPRAAVRGGAGVGAAGTVAAPPGTGRPARRGTAPAPGSVTAAATALDILNSYPELPERARATAAAPTGAARGPGLAVGEPAVVIAPVVPGPPVAAPAAVAACAGRGAGVGRLRSPSVPADGSRPDLTARAEPSSDDLAVITNALTAVAEVKVNV